MLGLFIMASQRDSKYFAITVTWHLGCMDSAHIKSLSRHDVGRLGGFSNHGLFAVDTQECSVRECGGADPKSDPGDSNFGCGLPNLPLKICG